MTTQQKITMHRSILNYRSMILALVGMGFMAPPFFAQNAGNSPITLSVPAAGSAKHGVETRIQDLDPFTHFASIPASSDPEMIKFEKVKAMKVSTEVKSTRDPSYCDNVQFNEPGGSMYCPFIQHESPTPAYQVTYSFKSEPLASDDQDGNRNFTFQVYFRPEELPPAALKAISTRQAKRAELATYFNVTTSRLPVHGAVIDEANSSFCSGNYMMDGNWVQNDPHCQDKISFKYVTMPSDSITVQVEPVSPQEAVAER